MSLEARPLPRGALALGCSLLLLAASCARPSPALAQGSGAAGGQSASAASPPSPADPRLDRALAALSAARPGMGDAAAAAIRARILASPAPFLADLEALLAQREADPGRFVRVDKIAPPLSADFVPRDLVPLAGLIPLAKEGLELRRGAAGALAAMAKAAKTQGVTLVAASSYRSWSYQKTVFEREVRLYGEVVARRESAEPGRSQHQLGTALDFNPIDDAFEKTAAFAWLSAHARDYGFSRSYPDGMEGVTGYRPESWHWRWLGAEALRLQAAYFGDLQQYLMEFLAAYR